MEGLARILNPETGKVLLFHRRFDARLRELIDMRRGRATDHPADRLAPRGLDRSVHNVQTGHMKRASISTLKARLSEYLRLVRNGEEVIVTDRGSPVARLAPLEPAERHDTHLRGLIEAGLVRPSEGPLPDDFWERPRPRDPEGRSLRAILEEREQGR